ncbi:MAG: hypothetical protein KF726_14860 [Anaerolineae bacterium]|nr:hypothetical protein [Anaerolineae bacterium]
MQTPPPASSRRLSIDVRSRLPVWGLRLIAGMIMLFMSEIVMWQNPPSRQPVDWIALYILYVMLAALLLDFVVRFQARDVASLLLVSGAYALIQSAVLNPGALSNLPISLVVRGLGLQTAAAFYGLLFFVLVMRGRQPDALQVIGALAIGLLWGAWLHWYPIQQSVAWGEVALQTAQLYALLFLVIIGVLFFAIGPRFRVVREKQFELVWWEQIVAIVPLFIALLIGMVQNVIPAIPLIVVVAIGAFVGWALSYQRGGYEPSILAEMMFAAPNLITHIVLSLIFLGAGTLAYSLIQDKDSVVGVILYFLVLGFGVLWLPAASVLIFLKYLNNRNREVVVDQGDDGERE